MNEDLKFANHIKQHILSKLSIYSKTNTPSLLFLLKEESKNDSILFSLLDKFHNTYNDTQKFHIIEEILFHITGATYVSPNFYRKNINSQYFFVLEILDILSFISFSVREYADSYSDAELSEIVNCEFEDLKLNLYVSLVNQENSSLNLKHSGTTDYFTSLFNTAIITNKEESKQLFYQLAKVIETYKLLDDEKITEFRNKEQFLFHEEKESEKTIF